MQIRRETQENQRGDRFIPNRRNIQKYHYKIMKENQNVLKDKKTLKSIFPFFKKNLLNFNEEKNSENK